MSLRIDHPPLDNTRELTREVMRIVKKDERALFLVPRGQGEAIVQRIRVTVSRARKKLERNNIPQQYFKLHHSIHPWTELVEGCPGQRFDCVIMWRSRGLRHIMLQDLEAML